MFVVFTLLTLVNLTSFSDLLHEVGQLLEGCRRYYFKSLARSSALTVAMVTPSKVS